MDTFHQQNVNQRWPVPTDASASPRGQSSLPAATLSFDDIEVREVIGHGGNADVHRATTRIKGQNRTIAIKKPRVRGTLSNERIAAVLAEAETWQRIDDHEHVVGIVDWGLDAIPWVAMEYMDGGTLRVRLDEDGPLPVAEALWISRCLARAVHYGHRHGIAHLDLKPANVLFRKTDDDTWPVPKLADWGLAKRLIEHSGSVDGISPDYAAPEQVDPDYPAQPDDYTDIYQLGVIVYELLTDDLPYDATGLALSQRIADSDADPVPPSERRDELTSEVDAVILPALAYDRTERYDSAINFVKGIEALQAEGAFPPIVSDLLEARSIVAESNSTETEPNPTAAGPNSTEDEIHGKPVTETEDGRTPRELQEIPGVGPARATELTEAGIQEPSDLVDEDVESIVERTSHPEPRVRSWKAIAHPDSDAPVSRIDGIGEEDEQQLAAVGITTVRELACADPDVVKDRPLLSSETFGTWILRARTKLDIDSTTPVSHVDGIGTNAKHKLKDIGITTVGDLARADPTSAEELPRLSNDRLDTWILRTRAELEVESPEETKLSLLSRGEDTFLRLGRDETPLQRFRRRMDKDGDLAQYDIKTFEDLALAAPAPMASKIADSNLDEKEWKEIFRNAKIEFRSRPDGFYDAEREGRSLECLPISGPWEELRENAGIASIEQLAETDPTTVASKTPPNYSVERAETIVEYAKHAARFL